MTTLQPSWPRRHRRGLMRAGLVLLAVYALYLLAANIFLNSAFAEQAFNKKPERFHVHWAWAMSLYPGHIHVRGLQVGGHGRATVWQAQSPVADGRIKVLPLLARRLSFGTIDADDVTVAIDRSDTILLPDKPPAPKGLRDPWDLHFDAIRTSSLGAVRWGEWVVDGGGEASFAMDKTLRGGRMEILPSYLRLPAARVRKGDTVLARDARFDLAFSMAPNLATMVRGVERVQLLDARLQVAGRAPGLDVRERDKGKLAFGKGAQTGRVDLDLTLHRGALQPGGKLRWTAPIVLDSATAAAQDYRLHVDADVLADAVALRVRVPKQGDRADFVAADLRVTERRADRFLQPRALLAKASGEVDLRWHFATLRWINPLLSKGWLRFDGDAEMIAQLQVRGGKLQPGSHVDVPRAALQADLFDNVVTGIAHASARVGEQATTVNLVADRFEMAPRAARQSQYLQGTDLRVDLVSSGDLSRFKDHLKARIRFDDARIPDLRNYNRNLPGDSLRFLGGSGRMTGDLAIDAAGEVGSGVFKLRGDAAAIQLGVSKLTGNLRLDTRLSRVQKTGRHYSLDGFTIGLDDVRVIGSTDVAPWWAKFSLDGAQLEWRAPFKVDGDARLDMKDASVLLSLFAERSAFPKWIGSLVDSGETNATGRLHVDGDTLVLDGMHASNDRIDLDARLKVAAGKPNGDLYARWGVLGLGVELRGGARKLHLANAREWYASQPPLLGKPAAPKND